MTTYRYAEVEESGTKYVDVERAGKFQLNDDDNAADKAKAVIVSTQQVPEDSVELEKVDNLQEAVVTSNVTPRKEFKRKR